MKEGCGARGDRTEITGHAVQRRPGRVILSEAKDLRFIEAQQIPRYARNDAHAHGARRLLSFYRNCDAARRAFACRRPHSGTPQAAALQILCRHSIGERPIERPRARATGLYTRTLQVVLSVVLLLTAGCGGRDGEPADVATVEEKAFTVWSTYEGILDARQQHLIMSQLSGSATIMSMAPEGSPVREGDLLLRFDDAALQRDYFGLARDYEVARAEYDSLMQAKLPMELAELKGKVADAREDLRSEEDYLRDCEKLVKEQLLSEQELEAQRALVSRKKAILSQVTDQLMFAEKYLHPAQGARARASFTAAEQALMLASNQLDACRIRAPAAGMLVYLSTQVGTEYRTARIGDAVYRNQPLMAVVNMSNAVVNTVVSESELPNVAAGQEAVVLPLAFPGLRLRGVVDSVGSMAQQVPGKPSWQKYFRIQVRLEESDPRLRPGMSVQAVVTSYASPRAVVVPRLAVWWEDGEPRALVRRRASRERRTLRLGRCNATHFEVLGGLEPGEKVVCR